MPRILAAANGWVTVANFGREQLDTYGWKLSDLQALSQSNLTCDALAPGECIRILFNSQGVVQLLDSNNVVIDKIQAAYTQFPVVYALDDRLEVDSALFEEIPNAGVGILCITSQSTATLANLSDTIVDLNGWELADTSLEGILKPGETSRFSTTARPLNNNTFLLQLINSDQNIVDSVLYKHVETDSPVVFDLDHRIAARDFAFNSQNPILSNKAALLDPVQKQEVEDEDEDEWEDANDEDETIQGSTAADIASEEFQSRTFSVSTKDELDETLGVDAVIEDEDAASSPSPRLAPVRPPRSGTAKTGSLSYSNADMSKQDRSVPASTATEPVVQDGTPTLPQSAVFGGDASSWIKASRSTEAETPKTTTEYKPVDSYSDTWTKASEQAAEDTAVASRSLDPSSATAGDTLSSSVSPPPELTEEKALPEVASREIDPTVAATAGMAAVGAAGLVASGSFGDDVDGQEIDDEDFEDYSSEEDEEYKPAEAGSYDRNMIYSPTGVPIGTTLPPIPEENEVLGEEAEDESSMLPVEITAPPDAIEAIETVVEEEPVSRNSVLAKVKQWNQSDDDKEAVQAYVMSREYEGAVSPTSSPGLAARGSGGTGGTGAVVNELTSKWNTAVVEQEETRDVAKPVEGGSTEVVEGLTSKWNKAASEDVPLRSGPLATETSSTQVVDGLKAKWNNAVTEEAQSRTTEKSVEHNSTEVVEGLTSKWNKAVEKEASTAAVSTREVRAEELNQSSDSVKNMTEIWNDTKADDVNLQSEKAKATERTAKDQSRTIIMDDDDNDVNGKVSEASVQPNSPVNPGTVDALQSMWSSPKVTATSRSVEASSPVNPGTVETLSSMWSSPKAEATAAKSVDPTSPVNPGTVDALSSMWSSPKAEKTGGRSVAAPSPISPGSVNKMTTKWKDIATETNVFPAVAVGATAGTVAAMTGKWAAGKKESEEKPIARSISQDEKGDVGKLQAKWTEVENNAPVGTTTQPRAKRVSKGFRPKPKSVVSNTTTESESNEVRAITTTGPVDNKVEIVTEKTESGLVESVEPSIQNKEADDLDDDDDEFEDTFDEPIGAFPVGDPLSNPKSLDLDAELGNDNENNTAKSTFRESPTSSSSRKVGGVATTERSILPEAVQEKTEQEISERPGFVFEDNVIPLMKEKNPEDLPKVRDASLEKESFSDDKKEEKLVIEDNVISEWNTGTARKDSEAMPTVESFAEDGSDVVSEWKETGESSKVISEWKADNEEEGELENSSSVIVHEDIDIGLSDAVGMRGNSWMINESAADLDPSSMVESRAPHAKSTTADLEIMEAIEVDEEVAIDPDYVRARGSLELRRSLEKLPEREVVHNRRRKFALFNKRKREDKGSFTAPLAINATDSMKIEQAPRQLSSFVEPHIMDINQVTPVGSTNNLLPSVSSKKSSTFPKLSKLTDALTADKTPVGTGPEAFTASGVGILCAMINPVGDENEWVVIANFSKKAVDLDGWALSDTKRKALRIGGVLQPGDSMKIENMRDEANNSAYGGSVQLANKQGCIMLFNATQNIVDSVTYVRTRERAIMEGLPFVFHFGKPFSVADTVHSEKVYPAVGMMALSTKNAGWITLANFSGQVIDLSKGWTLDDGMTKIELSGMLHIGRTVKLERMVEVRKTEGNFTLRSLQGEVVDSVKYSQARSSRLADGTPVVFHANI